MDALGVPVWRVASDAGDVVDANDCARTSCGWKRTPRGMPFAALANCLSIRLHGVARAITLEDVRGASDATSGDQPLSGILTAPGLAPQPLSLYVSTIGGPAERPADFVLLGIAERFAGESTQPPVSVTALSEGVAHELNNIGASLFGFVELAAESGSADRLLSNLLGEIRIGVSRISGVASLLEALAEQNAERVPTTLAACVGITEADGSGAAFDLRWSCDSSTLVIADPDHTRRALRLLKDLALPHLGNGSRAEVSASLATSSESRCETCGGAIPPGGARLSIGAGQFGNFSDRQRPHRTDTSVRRLSLTACAHVTHLAGGHLQRAGAAEPLAIVLPLAKAQN